MAKINQDVLPPPPGLITSLSAGFDAIANNAAVLVIPVAVDVFLWLGPHYRLQSLLEPIISSWSLLIKDGMFQPDVVNQAQEIWLQFADNFNLLATVRTFPIGIPGLISSISTETTPYGTASLQQVGSTSEALLWVMALSIIGFLLGSVYFYWVSSVVLKRSDSAIPTLGLGRAMGQSVLLMFSWLIILSIILVPLLLLLTLLSLTSPALAQFVYLVAGVIFLWFLMPLFFSPHGIFTYGHPALKSITQGFYMARFTLPTSGLFLITAFVLSQGMAYLWRTPSASSWMLLVGIAGNAFISSSILAASFIFYRDTNAWLQVVLERLKAASTTAKV